MDFINDGVDFTDDDVGFKENGVNYESEWSAVDYFLLMAMMTI